MAQTGLVRIDLWAGPPICVRTPDPLPAWAETPRVLIPEPAPVRVG